MGEKTAELPKCLLEIGGKSLVEHQLEILADCGVGPVGIVVGFCADQVREVVGFRAEFIENREWRRTNSLYSFWLAREWMDGPIMILNSDLLLDPKIVESVLAVDGDAIAFDSSSGSGAEQMKLAVDGGHVSEMSKTLCAERVEGENVGLLKFQASTVGRLSELAGSIVGAGGENDWMSSAVSRLAQEHPMQPVDVSGLPWAEIDFPFDLDRARKETWPAIRANRRARKWPRRFVNLTATAAAAAIVGAIGSNVLHTPEPPIEWETVEILDLESSYIKSDTRKERWWLLSDDGDASLELSGPTRLRVDSRVLLADDSDLTRYAVEVAIDGEPQKWRDHLPKLSKRWRADGQPLGKRENFKIELPVGQHTVRLRFVGDGYEGSLIRVSEEFTGRTDDE